MTTESKVKYGASASLAMTSLASLATDTNLLAGAESVAFDNTSSLFMDVLVDVTIKMGTSACTASKNIEVWIIPMLNDTPTWPDVFDGTDSAETATSRNLLFGYGFNAKVFNTDTTASQLYQTKFAVRELCGYIPNKFVLFVTQNSGQALAASGSSVNTQGVTYTSA